MAEQAKTKRCLLSPEFIYYDKAGRVAPGPVNVIPQGGDFYVAGTQARLQSYIKRME